VRPVRAPRALPLPRSVAPIFHGLLLFLALLVAVARIEIIGRLRTQAPPWLLTLIRRPVVAAGLGLIVLGREVFFILAFILVELGRLNGSVCSRERNGVSCPTQGQDAGSHAQNPPDDHSLLPCPASLSPGLVLQ
jgi:hypothetical protein